MNSLLSGFSSVLTPQKKGDDLETREIQTQSGHVHPDNFQEDDNSQFYRWGKTHKHILEFVKDKKKLNYLVLIISFFFVH